MPFNKQKPSSSSKPDAEQEARSRIELSDDDLRSISGGMAAKPGARRRHRPGLRQLHRLTQPPHHHRRASRAPRSLYGRRRPDALCLRRMRAGAALAGMSIY